MNKIIIALVVVLIVLVGLLIGLELTTNKSEPMPITTNQQTTQRFTELQQEVITSGSGTQEVKIGDTITIQYTGWLADGTKFDSTYDSGNPFSFTVGTGRVIAGFDQGVVGMKVGEERRLKIPSALGYGSSGVSGVIPADADLIFEVKLLTIVEGGETEAINLEAVGDFTGSGTATRRYDDESGTFTHTVTAQLAEPAAGKFYEGWLVRQDPLLEFFSTGRLEKEGSYFVLTYTADEDKSEYQQVVITEETEELGLDNEPETHVLEGEFE